MTWSLELEAPTCAKLTDGDTGRRLTPPPLPVSNICALLSGTGHVGVPLMGVQAINSHCCCALL